MSRPGKQPSFVLALTAVAALALAIRLLYTAIHRGAGLQGDALTFWTTAGHVVDGEGFRRVFEDVPTAEHPPGHVLLLALQRWAFGIADPENAKWLLCVVGTVTVVLIALIARRVAGDRAGLIAGGLAAVYPNLVNPDASLLSETPYLAVLAGGLLLALRARATPTLRTFAALGAAVALATLVRGEAIALLALLVVPLAWQARRTLPLAAAGLAAAALVLTPWTVRNLTTFDEPVLVSTNGSAVFVGANCPRTYGGELIGSWAFSCFGTAPIPGDESDEAIVFRDRGVGYALDHTERWPAVVGARAGRMLEVFRPAQSVFFQGTEGRSETLAWAGIVMFWGLLVGAAAGLVVVRRRRGPTWVLGAPLVLSVLVCLGVYGSTRLRVAAEPSLVVLTAVALASRLPGRRASPPAPAPAT